MIKIVEFYSAECDSCRKKELSNKKEEYSQWIITVNKKTYCDKCYQISELDNKAYSIGSKHTHPICLGIMIKLIDYLNKTSWK